MYHLLLPLGVEELEGALEIFKEQTDKIRQKYLKQLFQKKTLQTMDVPYFIQEHFWMSASDEATLKTIFGGSKPSSKLTLRTKWYHSCDCCDDSRSCEQLKKSVTDKYGL